MTRFEKLLLAAAAVFFVLAIWLLPASDAPRTTENSFTLPGPTAMVREDDALILTLCQEIDLNHASAEELRALPGVGPVLAEAIVAYRDEHGPFSSPAELLNVKGYGEAALQALYDAMGQSRGP